MALKRSKKTPAKKDLTYELIPQEGEIGAPMYERLYAIVDEHHDDLAQQNVRIALAWATSWKADPDGHLVIGKCKKASDLDRELAPFDFIILLNKDFWQSTRVTTEQRTALLDHELMHAAIAYDADGFPKKDARGRTMFRIRKHDIEEFRAIVDRHGCYKGELEEFGRAILRAERRTASGWSSYTAVHETLKAVGVNVAPTVIAMWPEDERREVHTWALVRLDTGERVNIATSQTMPACLAAAVTVPPIPGVDAH